MRIRLNAQNVNTLQPVDGRRTSYKDIGCPGLVYRVSRATRAWYLVVSRRGKKVPLLLGYYQVPGGSPPKRRVDAPLLTLREARDAVEEEIKKADRGMGTVAARGVGTAAVLVGKYIDAVTVKAKRSQKPGRLKTVSEYLRLWHAEILGTPVPTGGRRRKVPQPRVRAPWADVPAAELQRPEVREWLRGIAKRAPATANAVLTLLKAAFNWAVAEEMLEYNPLLKITKPGATGRRRRRGRYLATLEVRALWIALGELRDRTAYADATALLLLTGVRRRCVLEARISQFEDVNVVAEGAWGVGPRWVIPEELTKSDRAHMVPLSPQALDIVRRRIASAEAAGLSCLFPVGKEAFGEDRPMTWASRWVKRVKARTAEIHGAAMDPWHVHLLRHTVRTHLTGSMRVPDDVGRLITMHARPGVDGIYNLAELLDERRAALVAWAAWLDRLAASEPKHTADVRPFTARR